ncbi:D-serine deaminase-like pyridoxal phosphate-dependent protein [Caulobacter ginsengisoli]|uniref:D-serine deaminase-like pyridoxal phosphate-dependent protein n=1 Tax=Caulobacter ginsengisoli TaxID=400775 RepID=A0ABU0IWI5_9CAUL|nr:DSD1 family PLP-dependent enzyme [Caulobacter ginsengisoli]MDQ0466374.1 D-serine deaminase-like pyridoxal phosphate-dependent protein [Caulobacter ginsengisoli]
MFEGFTPPQTPLLAVDRAALTRNLKTMQDLCDSHGVRLRSHGKTHKCSTLGRLQQAGGAVGLCAQTVGEAEAFVKGGVTDVLVTAPPPPWGAVRLAALARTARVGSVADSAEQIERLGAAARAAGVTLDLVVDIDPGTHRTGCHPDDAVALARLAASTEGLNYMGVQAYAGHLQHIVGLEERRVADHAVCAQLAAMVAALTNANLAPEVVTGGGTGTHSFALASGLFNELQAGSYAVMDVEYADCAAPGGGSWPFQASLFVAASVVSANHKSHVTVDAGFKAMSMDGPPARVASGAAAGSLWRPMGDEHGMIIHPDGLALLRGGNFVEAVEKADRDASVPWPADAPKAGGLVWLQPGHCDPTINLYDALHVVAEDGSFERWAVDARRVS